MNDINYSSIREDKGYHIKCYQRYVLKKFNLKPRAISIKERDERFKNCLSSYLFFKKINWPWSPELISFNRKNQWIKIERIYGKSISELLKNNQFLNINFWDFTRRLSNLNKSLANNNIDYKNGDLKNILINREKRIYLIDFEYCLIGKYSGRLIIDLVIDLVTRVHLKRLSINKSVFKFIFCLLLCFLKNPLISIKGPFVLLFFWGRKKIH